MYEKIQTVNRDSLERHIRDVKSVHNGTVISDKSSDSNVRVVFKKKVSYLEFIRDMDKSRLVIKGIRKDSEDKFRVNNINRILTTGYERLYMEICFDNKERKTYLLTDD